MIVHEQDIKNTTDFRILAAAYDPKMISQYSRKLKLRVSRLSVRSSTIDFALYIGGINKGMKSQI